MAIPTNPVKMVPVNANQFEAVGYAEATRELSIKFRNAPALCFEDVPRFRYTGLMSAPRKDAYYDTYIKNRFLTKPVQLPAQT